MFIINLKARMRNKNWWIFVISYIVAIGGYFGFDITKCIGQDWKALVGIIFGLLGVLGITVDNSTKGLSDQVIQETTVQAIKAADTKEEVKIEASTTAVNSTVSEKSQPAAIQNLNASSKIAVDNPEV